MYTIRSNSRNENNGSDNDDEDSSDSFSVISEILAVSDLDCGYTSDDDENDNHNANSNTNTDSSRHRSVPCLRNNNLFQSSAMNSNNNGRSSNTRLPFSSSTTTTTTTSSSSSSLSSTRDLRQRLAMLNDTWPNSAHLASSSSSIPGTNVEHGRFNRNDHIVSDLRGTFADLLPPVPVGERRESNIVTDIQHLFDKQERTIELLKKTLSEKESQLKKLRASRPVPILDGKEALPSLLERYPQAMNTYRKKIEHDEYKKEFDKCTQQYEAQKKEIINTHKQNYRIYLSKYKKKFRQEVDRICNRSETRREEEDV